MHRPAGDVPAWLPSTSSFVVVEILCIVLSLGLIHAHRAGSVHNRITTIGSHFKKIQHSKFLVSLFCSTWALRLLGEPAVGATPTAVGGRIGGSMWSGDSRTAAEYLTMKVGCDGPYIGHSQAFIGRRAPCWKPTDPPSPRKQARPCACTPICPDAASRFLCRSAIAIQCVPGTHCQAR